LFGTRSRSSSRIFTQYFISYSAILLIPFVIGTALYSSAVRIIEDSSRKSAQAILEQTRDIVDARIGELDSTARQITLSPKVLSLLYLDELTEGSGSYYGVWNLWKEMPNYGLANSFISSFYLCARKAKVIVSADEVLRNDPAQYERVFKYRDWDYRRWNDFLFGRYHTHDFLPGVTVDRGGFRYHGVFYVQSIPIEYSRSPLGVFMVLIEDSTIRDLMRRLDTGKSGLVLISDSSGDIVTSMAGERCTMNVEDTARMAARGSLGSLERSGFIVSRTVSPLTKWNYVSVLPAAMVLAPVNLARNIALALLAAGLVLGLSAAASMAQRSARPIRRIVDRFAKIPADGSPGACRNELEYLDNAFTDLLKRDESLRNEMETQVPVMRSDLTRRLLLGLYRNEDEALALAKTARIDLAVRTFGTAVIRIEGYRGAINPEVLGELEIIRAVIREGLRSEGGFEIVTHEQDDAGLAVLFLFPLMEMDGAASAMETLLASLSEKLVRDYRVHISFSIGKPVSRFSELPVSHLQARLAIDAHLVPPGGNEASGPGRRDAEAFLYPMETELRLVAALKHADQAEVGAIVRELKRENLDGRSLDAAMFADFAAALRNSVIRSFGDDGGIAADLAAVDRADRASWFRGTEEILSSFCGRIERSHRSEKRELAEAVARRLSETFSNPNLTILMASEEFGLSESSFYHFFREAFGVSFSDYLEDLRIRSACALLSGGQSSIKDAAAAVGFVSDTTFRRAFHRVIGVSPSEYLRAVAAKKTTAI
jgi:two-component system, response regulator YesN